MSIEDIRLRLEQLRANSSHLELNFDIHIPLLNIDPSSPKQQLDTQRVGGFKLGTITTMHSKFESLSKLRTQI